MLHFICCSMSAVKLLWQPVRCRMSKTTVNRWRMVVSGTWKYDDQRLYVTQGRSPSVTCSTEGRPISMSHERLYVICFVIWPTRFAYKMAAFLRILPRRWRHGRFVYKMSAWEFCPQDGSVRDLPTRWRQCRVSESLPTRRRQQTKRKQKQRRIYLTFAFSERHVMSPG